MERIANILKGILAWSGFVVLGVAAEPDHWAFRPLPLDPGHGVSVDSFIRAKLADAQLKPAPQADRRTLIRRLYFDLHGLPPTPERVAAFLAAEDSEQAYAVLVDELLASPRYGERWAQYWLDLVRYADTDGFEVNTERPNAWPYRDYVIRAFNEDKPYDRFVFEQLAGDAVGEDAATGFMVASAVLLPGQIGKDDASKRLARQEALDEIIVATCDTFLALSVGCARCHDHKFDPIPQRDYYAMQAFFAGVEYGERPLGDPLTERRLEEISEQITSLVQHQDGQEPIASPDPTPGPTERAPVNPARNVERIKPTLARLLRFTALATIDDNRHEPCLDELEIFDLDGNNVALSGRASSSGDRGGDPQHQLAHINDGKYGNGRSWISDAHGEGWVEIELAEPVTIGRIVWGRDREGKFQDRLPVRYRIELALERDHWSLVASSEDRLPIGTPFDAPDASKLAELNAQRMALEESGKVFAGTFREPDATYLLNRGDPEQKGERMAASTLGVLEPLTLTLETPERERRLALASWIANATNPLTARVIVNRIWQYHFGRGLVDTASDFGLNGARPSHPELLDWLAGEFVRHGWSIKTLHRQILLSETFRQSNRIDPRAQEIDHDCRLLWRFPSRRLEAEAIRDSILAVSGNLNLEMGGPGFNFFQSRGGLNGFPVIDSFTEGGLRRMIYQHKVRMERAPVFGSFDCPDAGQATPRRSQSTTAIQALNLFNSQFTIDEATIFAGRAGSVDHAYQLAFGRDPSPAEKTACEATVRAHGLATLCRVLFNSNEFLFMP